jgi:hypothetical protein
MCSGCAQKWLFGPHARRQLLQEFKTHYGMSINKLLNFTKFHRVILEFHLWVWNFVIIMNKVLQIFLRTCKNSRRNSVSKCDNLLSSGLFCSTLPNLLSVPEDPQPSDGCPRANGYFRHSDSQVCDKFFNCVDGVPNVLPCPPGLIYDDSRSTCAWPAESRRTDCVHSKRGRRCQIHHPLYHSHTFRFDYRVCLNFVSNSKQSRSEHDPKKKEQERRKFRET